jgi:hypothetical protein
LLFKREVAEFLVFSGQAVSSEAEPINDGLHFSQTILKLSVQVKIKH